MKSISIPIHSIVEVITNSSTEIYTMIKEKSAEYIKEFINKILSIAESNVTADDLFDIRLVGGSSFYSFHREKLRKAEPELYPWRRDMSTKEKGMLYEKMDTKIDQMLNDDEINVTDTVWNGAADIELRVTIKGEATEQAENIVEFLKDMFYSEEIDC